MTGASSVRDESVGWVSLAAFLGMALATVLITG